MNRKEAATTKGRKLNRKEAATTKGRKLNRKEAAQNIFNLLEDIDRRCQHHDTVSTTVEEMTDVEKTQLHEFISFAWPPPECVESDDGCGYRMLYLWCKMHILETATDDEKTELLTFQTDCRTRDMANPTGMADFLAPVEHVEIKIANDGRIWVNINGACALRVAPGKHSITHDYSPDQFKNG